MTTRAHLILIASLAATGSLPAAAAAQRDTIRLGAPRDTVTLTAADTATPAAPARDPRWATPFAVQSSGQAVPRRDPHDVVWLDADSVRARRRAARLAAAADSAGSDSTIAEPPADSSQAAESPASADSAPPPRRTRRAAADSADAPARPRTAARDSATTRRATTTTRARTHRVADGETLYGIARRYGVTTAQLRALNPDLVPGDLAAGTVLRLPAAARAATAASTDGDRAETPRRPPAERAETPPARRPAAETRPSPRRRTHTVVAHETLFGIARKYGVTVDALKAANRLEGDALRVGQTLTIPASAPR